MLLAAWFVSAALTGAYNSSTACSSVPAALRSVSKAWLVAMPVAATQLVLVTAAESNALVGEDGFASVLPLAASGPGEPLATGMSGLCTTRPWALVGGAVAAPVTIGEQQRMSLVAGCWPLAALWGS